MMSSKTKHRHKEHKIETKHLAPVKDAVREYRVIEDGAYAYHLQNEEIEHHYSQNVNMRRLVMDDIRKAKELQDEEDRRARILTIDEEIEVKQMDEELAEIIQEEIFTKSVKEEEERKQREGRDEELALLMEEKERRQVQRAKMYEENDQQLAERMQNMRVTPPGSRDEERIRLMTDEELARRLQDEESFKAKKTRKRKEELKSVVEMQDEELAKYIHDREVEAAEMKFKKEKRKSKKKGKWDNEPLYYDDNVSPPAYHEVPSKGQPEDLRRLPHNGHYSPSDRRTPDNRRLHEHRHHKDERRPERPPPPNFPASHNTEIKVPLDDSQQRSSERHLNRATPAEEYSRDFERNSHDYQRRAHSEKNRKTRGSADNLDMAENRHRSHNEKQRSRPELPNHGPSGPRPHDAHHHEGHRDRPRDSHYHDSGKHGREPRPRDAPHRDRSPEHRDNSKKRGPTQTSGPPMPKPRGSLNHSHSTPQLERNADLDEELRYSENFAKLTEKEIWNQNNSVTHKGAAKKKGGDCKQQ